MTEIHFYTHASPLPQASRDIAIRLAGKAFRQQGYRCLMLTGEEALETLGSDIAETANAFLPQSRINKPDARQVPVILATRQELEQSCPMENDLPELLINLHDDIPPGFQSFIRLAEIIGWEDAQRASGRKRFLWYQSRGYPLHHHQLD